MNLTHPQLVSTAFAVAFVVLYVVLKVLQNRGASVTKEVRSVNGRLIDVEVTTSTSANFGSLPFWAGVGIFFSVIAALEAFGVVH